MSDSNVMDKLFEVIESRKNGDPENSYVAGLMQKGIQAINAKIIEEAQEVCEAAFEEDKEHLVHEICDLFFHGLVLASHKEIRLIDLENELKRRFGTSGLVEKANRE